MRGWRAREGHIRMGQHTAFNTWNNKLVTYIRTHCLAPKSVTFDGRLHDHVRDMLIAGHITVDDAEACIPSIYKKDEIGELGELQDEIRELKSKIQSLTDNLNKTNACVNKTMHKVKKREREMSESELVMSPSKKSKKPKRK